MVLGLRIITLFTLILAATYGYCQMTVSNTFPYNNPVYLVEDVLVGQGVAISNVSVTGQSAQIGYFDGANSNIGLDAGVVLSTGDIFDIPSTGNPNPMLVSGPGDPDLLTIAQSVTSNPSAVNINATNDAAVLEFDFVPTGDTVRFNFVFASNEYTTWINSVYNDAFGFFVSGPGFTGPFMSPATFPNGAENLAFVPGTTTPITISTIYSDPFQTPPTMNDQYYLDNANGFNFNGFTTQIEIIFAVQCGQTYHFKFAVADGQDGALDTGVFLEAESFSSDDIEIALSTGTTSLGSDSTIVEGCTEAIFTFIRADTTDTLVIHFTSSGNAIEGLDFDTIGDSLVFYPGIDSIALVITPIADGIAEGQDTIRLSVLKITPCGDSVYVEGVVYIMEDYNVQVNTDSLSLNCPGDSVALIAVGSNGIPEFAYLWETGETNDTIWVNPSFGQFYTITVTDSCAISTVVDSFVVTVPYYQPLQVFAADTSLTCPGDQVSISALVTGGISGYSYTWSPSSTDTSTINVSPNTTTDYTIIVTDQCNNTEDTTITVSVPNLQPLQVLLTQFGTLACLGDALVLNAGTQGGSAHGLTYNWGHDGTHTDSSTTVIISSDTVFTVTVSDGCGDVAAGAFNTSVPVYSSVVAINPIYYLFCEGDSLEFNGSASGGAGTYNYLWRGDGYIEDDENNKTIAAPSNELGFAFSAIDQCGNGDTLEVTIEFDECEVIAPIVFTPNGDQYNNQLKFTNLEKHPNSRIIIYNRWGTKIYESENYLNNWTGGNQPDGVYYYVLYVSNGQELNSYFHILR